MPERDDEQTKQVPEMHQNDMHCKSNDSLAGVMLHSLHVSQQIRFDHAKAMQGAEHRQQAVTCSSEQSTAYSAVGEASAKLATSRLTYASVFLGQGSTRADSSPLALNSLARSSRCADKCWLGKSSEAAACSRSHADAKHKCFRRKSIRYFTMRAALDHRQNNRQRW